jgi:membrane associated rhomboid family serine protease
VFVPLYDINPLRRIQFQYVNLALIAVNILVYLLFQLQHEMPGQECAQALFAKTFGIIPLELIGTSVSFPGCPATEALTGPIPEPLTLFTYMFLHGDLLHLGSNMLFLWVFGDNVEDALGHVRYLIFFVLCGVAGGLLHAGMANAAGYGFLTTLGIEPTSPLIGASGAISGVVVAYLMLHPRVLLWVLVFRFIPLRVQAFWVLGAWIGINFAFALLKIEPTVAWWAHIGGMLAGAVLLLLLKRRDVELFAPPPA